MKQLTPHTPVSIHASLQTSILHNLSHSPPSIHGNVALNQQPQPYAPKSWKHRKLPFNTFIPLYNSTHVLISIDYADKDASGIQIGKPQPELSNSSQSRIKPNFTHPNGLPRLQLRPLQHHRPLPHVLPVHLLERLEVVFSFAKRHKPVPLVLALAVLDHAGFAQTGVF